jgi:hypothetical protein
MATFVVKATSYASPGEGLGLGLDEVTKEHKKEREP